MNPLTTLRQPLALLLISACLGVYAPAMAKEKQPASLQCEQNGEFKPCPGDNTANLDKAQADDGTTVTEKKQKRKKKKTSKKSAAKKSKATQSVDE